MGAQVQIKKKSSNASHSSQIKRFMLDEMSAILGTQKIFHLIYFIFSLHEF